MRQRQTKLLLRSNKQMKIKKTAQELHAKLPTLLQRSMDMSQERGASTWLSALPLLDHGFALHKSAFRDALALRYNWPLKKTPSHCCCGQHFSVEHALSCPTGGFPSIRHNEVRDLTAQLLSEVCHGVSTEPHLQPVTEEKMFHRSANTNDNARLDVAMYGFWGGKFEKAFIDVRVLNPSAPSNKKLTTEAMYRKHELEKKRQYEERIREIEHSSFTPLVMSTTGGLGNIATTFYRRLAAMIAEKRDIPYCKMMNLIRCKLSFALLRSSIMCIRGARSRTGHYTNESYTLQIAEGHI